MRKAVKGKRNVKLPANQYAPGFKAPIKTRNGTQQQKIFFCFCVSVPEKAVQIFCRNHAIKTNESDAEIFQKTGLIFRKLINRNSLSVRPETV